MFYYRDVRAERKDLARCSGRGGYGPLIFPFVWFKREPVNEGPVSVPLPNKRNPHRWGCPGRNDLCLMALIMKTPSRWKQFEQKVISVLLFHPPLFGVYYCGAGGREEDLVGFGVLFLRALMKMPCESRTGKYQLRIHGAMHRAGDRAEISSKEIAL